MPHWENPLTRAYDQALRTIKDLRLRLAAMPPGHPERSVVEAELTEVVKQANAVAALFEPQLGESRDQ